MKKLILLFAGFIFAITTIAKDGYSISVSAPQLANKSIYLAGYYDAKIYAFDTLSLDAQGKGVFEKNTKLDEGMYLFYLHAGRFYDFILGPNQTLSATIDTTKTFLEIKGPSQTEAFVSFGEFMTLKRTEQVALRKELEAAKGDTNKEAILNERIKKLDDEVVQYQTKLASDYKGDLLGLFVKSLIMPQFPPDLVNGDMKDENFLMKRYQYAKNHYWDNVELSDKRCWRLNFLSQKLNDYIENIVIQNPDSIILVAIDLIEKSKVKDKPYVYDKKNPSSYETMVNYMINYSVKGKLMCMDKLLVSLADKYYFTGQAPWADSTLMANITSEVRKVRHNQCGMKAANLRLTTFEGATYNLHDIKSKYTLVYFYEPSCGHCKETTPKIYEIFQKYRYKGFEVAAICITTNKKEWKDFIDDHKLYDWKNSWDPNRYSNYWVYYDTSTTPGVYLLDSEKKIVAKKIDSASLDKILEFELNTPNK